MRAEVLQCWDKLAGVVSCPVCQQPLTRDCNTFGCALGHRFDLAKQGHLNLLGRAAPVSADTADMVAARDRFLTAGHYRPITDALAAAVPASARRVLEVGAGTGHHLAGVLDVHAPMVGIASDISPAAARRAARSHPRAVSIVADTWTRLPIADDSVDAVLCVFAPRQASEFARVLTATGVALIVTPLPEHLHHLRAELDLLDIHPDKQQQLDEQFQGFTEVDRHQVRFTLELSKDDLADLVGMGPNAFHDKKRLSDQPRIDVAVELRVLAAPRR